ncbi:WD40-repeat-containing domain protein [Mycena pura]|uniref:WD40-repeat-containing domain protein n=1 Tax=Mycena pura TaxID=153505 RepID=A0AAD6UYR5_9AGAR|nr:WD40-repeat-containing domain protein [Mycena pura]
MSNPPYTLKMTLVPKQRAKAGALNCLLFFDKGAMLASGGDDQYLRTWDVRSGNCHQEITDPRWGQVTNLTLLDDSSSQPPAIFVGTGRGFVSVYLWTRTHQQFNKQAGTTTAVFPLDHPVESQALDPAESRFVAASGNGELRMYTVRDRKVLLLVWQHKIDSDIPRSVMFDREQLVVHTIRSGQILHFDPNTGAQVGGRQLNGAIGNVAMSPDRRVKVVQNMSKGAFEIYDPSNSSDPVSLTIEGKTSNKIKGIVFSEDSSTLACSTSDYHFIASGQSERPAVIYLWDRPTERKLTEERQLKLTEELEEAKAKKEAEDRKAAAKEAEKRKTASDEQNAEIEKLTVFVKRVYNCAFYLGLLIVAATLALACIEHLALIDIVHRSTAMTQRLPAFIPTASDTHVNLKGFVYPTTGGSALMVTVPVQANSNGCSPRTDLVFQAVGHNRRIAVHGAQVKVREAETERFWYIFFVNGKYSINQAISGRGKWKGTILVMKGGITKRDPWCGTYGEVSEGDTDEEDGEDRIIDNGRKKSNQVDIWIENLHVLFSCLEVAKAREQESVGESLRASGWHVSSTTIIAV